MVCKRDLGEKWSRKLAARYLLSNVTMSAMASQITDATIVCSGTYQRKYQRSASLAFVRGIHRLPILAKLHLMPPTSAPAGPGGGGKMCSGAWKRGPESPVGMISLWFDDTTMCTKVHFNKVLSVMAELAPFSPPAWERAAEHRTARTSGKPYVFATHSWSRVHNVNCD